MTEEKITGYIFIPLYNVTLSPDLLHTRIAGFKVITAEDYFSSYRPKFFRENSVLSTKDLDDDVRIPFPGMLSEHPYAKYLLVKQIRTGLPYTKETSDELDRLIKDSVNEFYHFVVAARLYKDGHLQAFRYYAYSKTYAFGGGLPFASSWNEIETFFSFRFLYLKYFNLEKSDIRKIYRLSKKIQKNLKTMESSTIFFSAYYGTSDVYDKLLRLITILEMLLTNDSKQEVNYRLLMRASCLLKRDVFQILKLAYDCRSRFIHSGTTGDESLKKLKQRYPRNPTSDTDDRTNEELIFQLIQTDLEKIVRDTLNAILNLVDKTGKSIGDIDKDLDQKILSQITKNA